MFDTAATRIVISPAATAATAAAVVAVPETVMGSLHFLWPLRHCMEDEKPTRMQKDAPRSVYTVQGTRRTRTSNISCKMKIALCNFRAPGCVNATGKARQKRQAREGTKFTRLRTRLLSDDPCMTRGKKHS